MLMQIMTEQAMKNNML